MFAFAASVANFVEAEVAETSGLGRRNQDATGLEVCLQPVQASLDQCPADAAPAFFRGDCRQVEDVCARCPVGSLDAADGADFPFFHGNEEASIEDGVIAAQFASDALGVIALGVGKGI